MPSLSDYRALLIVIGLSGTLVIASPSIALILPPRAGEKFSELYILGPGHMAEDYPFNVRLGETYRIILGVGNHMGSSAYYITYLKLRIRSELLPSSTAGTPSSLPALYEYRVFLSDKGSWEAPLDFSFGVSPSPNNTCLVESLQINGLTLHINKTALWDPERRGFYLQLFFELWIYDLNSRSFSFHDRFVGIWLNITNAR